MFSRRNKRRFQLVAKSTW